MASLDRLPLGGFDLLCARRGDRFRLTLGRSEGWVSQGAVAAAERLQGLGYSIAQPFGGETRQCQAPSEYGCRSTARYYVIVALIRS